MAGTRRGGGWGLGFLVIDHRMNSVTLMILMVEGGCKGEGIWSRGVSRGNVRIEKTVTAPHWHLETTITSKSSTISCQWPMYVSPSSRVCLIPEFKESDVRL